MAREWTILACPVCNEIVGPGEADVDEEMKCNGMPEHDRHKLTKMVPVTVREVE